MPSIKYILRQRSVTFALTFCLCFTTFVLLLKIAQKYDPLTSVEETQLLKSYQLPPFKRKDLLLLPPPPRSSNNHNKTESPHEPQHKPPTAKPAHQKPKPESKTFPKSDLNLASRLLINKTCDDFGFGTDLLVVVHSAPGNFGFRKVIRNTWGQQFKENGVMVYFLLGSTATLTSDLLQKLKTEDSAFEDLAQTAAPDHSQSLKSIAMLKFSSENCPKVRYLLKVPETTFVNAGNVTEYCERTFSNGRSILGGSLNTKMKTPKDIRDRYSLPGYSAPLLPDFLSGPVYLMSGEVPKLLLQAAYEEKGGFTAEDLYITGILAEKAKIKRKYLKQLANLGKTNQKVEGQNNNKCNMLNSWTILVKDEKEMLKLWTDRWNLCGNNKKV